MLPSVVPAGRSFLASDIHTRVCFQLKWAKLCLRYWNAESYANSEQFLWNSNFFSPYRFEFVLQSENCFIFNQAQWYSWNLEHILPRIVHDPNWVMLRVNWPVSILNWFQLESLCWTFFFQKLSKFWVSIFVRRTVVDKVLTNLWRWSLFFHETSVLTFLGRFTDFGRRKKEFSLLLNVSTPGKCCSGKKNLFGSFLRFVLTRYPSTGTEVSWLCILRADCRWLPPVTAKSTR